MRSALICVFFAIIVQREGSRAEQNDDFKPTPIPLNLWDGDQQTKAGTLQEFIKMDGPTVATLPPHYWEDALRHSVYLTLVRDKIDQLIAKGNVISPESRPNNTDATKQVDDHDLWEKIKTAPFDRVKEEPLPPKDVIILAKGKLFEEKDGYRFAEDDTSTEKCKNNCTQDVKAYWSVKRMRQTETSPGKYHYELTFSVMSQAPKKLKKPFENPVRTFAIRENTPSTTERGRVPQQVPQVPHNYGHPAPLERGQRAVWVHRNIIPSQNHQKRIGRARSLEGIFSSLFSDDENYDEIPHRPKHNSYVHQPKVGRFVSDRDSHFPKKFIPYSINPHPYRYSRPPLPPPPVSYVQQNPYFDINHNGVSHTAIDVERRPISPNTYTTKPPILPTPNSNYQLVKESTMDVAVKTAVNTSDYPIKEPEIHNNTYYVHSHSHKKPPAKVSFFPHNIRPPVYNAPPGVFVTMDKKPFKPMPPLKLLHQYKPQKSVPVDFRPSPQILDNSQVDLDSSADTAFRPMTLNLTGILNSKKGPKNHRKTLNNKKPPKKDGIIKYHRLTTVSPDIITVHNEGENGELNWAEILAAFSRTTPMASQREKDKEYSTENVLFTTITAEPETTTENTEEETIAASTSASSTSSTTTTSTTTTTTTTSKPKRTRPPPKFKTPEKFFKHKRVRTTPKSTPTTKSTRIYPTKKPSDDLNPQASSAPTSGANSVWENKQQGASTSTSTTTTTTTELTSTSTIATTAEASTTVKVSTNASTLATTKPTTTTKRISASTTTSTPSTTTTTEKIIVTTQPKNKNRFRQSTLMLKGTSVKHDRWSAPVLEKNRTTPGATNILTLRRKASKFQGYVPSSTPRQKDKERNREDHQDHGFSFNRDVISTTTAYSEEDIKVKGLQPPQTTVTGSDSDTSNDWSHFNRLEELNIGDDTDEDAEQNDIQNTKDNSEYIFPATSNPDYTTNNSDDINLSSNETVVALPHSTEKNKTKCKKKKVQTESTAEILQETTTSSTTTTASIPTSSLSDTSASLESTSDMLEELFEGFTMDDDTSILKQELSSTTPESETINESESTKHEEYIHIDDDLEDFLHSLDQKHNNHEKDDDEKNDEEYVYENDDEDSPFENEAQSPFTFEDGETVGRKYEKNEDYYDDTVGASKESRDRPLNILELMAME